MTDKPMGASKPGLQSPPDAKSGRDPLLTVGVIYHSRSWEDELEDSFLVNAANAAYLAGSANALPAELSLLLTADEEIRTLNKSWRGKDEATNVLSFPQDALHFGEVARPIGDVALAFETVVREAAASGIPVRQHTAHLVVHGVLHLLGYTHENDSTAKDMELLEVQVLASLGLPDPYALEELITGEGQ